VEGAHPLGGLSAQELLGTLTHLAGRKASGFPNRLSLI
jgi:hypothetical protein